MNATMFKQIINKNLFNIKLSVHEFFHTSPNTNFLNITTPITLTKHSLPKHETCLKIGFYSEKKRNRGEQDVKNKFGYFFLFLEK